VADKPVKPGSYAALIRRVSGQPIRDGKQPEIADAIDQSEQTSGKPMVAEKPGTKTLDYIALGLLLAPPAVVVDMYMKGTPIDWRRTAIAAIACWIAGGVAVFASHRWQTWRSESWRLLPLLTTAENRFWGKAIIVAAAIAFSFFLSFLLAPAPPPAHPSQLDSLQQEVANLPTSPEGLPAGTIWNDGGILAVTPQPAGALPAGIAVQRLMAMCDGLSPMQCDDVMQGEKDKAIAIEGKIQEPGPTSDGQMFIQVGPSLQVHCRFNSEKWGNRLRALRGGQAVKVIGKILPVSNTSTLLRLGECQLQ
jgi:hypothetical protein